MSKVAKSVIIRVFCVAKIFLMLIFVISAQKYIYVPNFRSVALKLRHIITCPIYTLYMPYTDVGLFVLVGYHVTDLPVNPYIYQNDRKIKTV